MLKRAKRSTLGLLETVGVSGRVRDSDWRRRRLLILCYHGISLADEHEWDSSLYMSAADFEGRLRAIQRGGYDVLPLGAALERLVANTLREPTIVITFDDGISDYARRAHPLLQRYGFPSTVYLTTYYCEHQKPVFPVFCSYVLWKGRSAAAVDASRITGARERWNLTTDAGRSTALDAIVQFAELSRMSGAEKAVFAEHITRELGVDYDRLVAQRVLHLLTPQDVTSLAAQGVDFQLHTHRHYAPPHRELFLRELRDNRERIRSMVGSEPTHFCYPCGVYSRAWFSWLVDAGVQSATTGVPGLVSARSNRMLLPRVVDTSNLSLPEFEAWLGGVGALLPRRPRMQPTRPFDEEVRVARRLSMGAGAIS